VVFAFFLSLCAYSKSVANLNKEGVILNGYDVVSYFQGDQPKLGVPQYQTTHDEAIYWFESHENKSRFLKDPNKYTPQFGGWCAYAVADSKSKVEVDPKSFLIQDGRLLVFYNGFLADTRKKWQNTKNKDPKTFLREADANWPSVKSKEP
tara:strand:+ start:7230 stop:7679 length:450 start_codon:yes stop_codon:yes gene_type:complete